jgi:uncharacterized protein YndB with AHSA1/START domain
LAYIEEPLQPGTKMPKVFVQAPPDQVFKAMCDLTRHTKWAAHKIDIVAGQEGPPAVGNTYTSKQKSGPPDHLTVTEMVPNELFRFHSVMPRGMGWEFDFTMTARPEAAGTVVTRDAKVTKFPMFMLPGRLLLAPLMGGIYDRKFLRNMKAGLETSA